MTTLTVRQAFELARFADRHGPVTVRPLSGGAVLVALDTRGKRRPTVGLALASTGRVVAHRRLDPAPAPDPEAEADAEGGGWS